MADKPVIKYGVRTGKKPGTEISILVPYITGRQTFGTERLIDRALSAGYIRGKRDDMIGIMKGLIKAANEILAEGNAVQLDNLLRVQLNVTGSVGADRTLTAANEIHSAVTILDELKFSASDFDWLCVDDTSSEPRVTGGSSPNCKKGEWLKEAVFVVSGRNLSYVAGTDKVKVSYLSGSTLQTIEVVPTEVSETSMRLPWPAALASVAAETKLTLTFTNYVTTATGELKEVVNYLYPTLIVEEEDPVVVDIIYSADHTSDVGKVWQNKNLMIEGSNLKLDANTYVQFDGLKDGAVVSGAFRMSAALTNANTFLELDYTGCEGDAFSFDNGSEITFKVKGVTAKATYTTGA